MEQTAFVLKTEENKALVRINRGTACGGNCEGCNMCNAKDVDRWVLNDVGASAGDTVLLYTKSAYVLLMAFTAYIAPIIAALVACAILTFAKAAKPVTDWVSIGVFIISIFVAAKAGFFRGDKYKSRITSVLSTGSGHEQN